MLELLLVFTILGIIAGIAIPGLSGVNKLALEASAISYLRTWPAAQELYRLRFGSYADADQQIVLEQFVGNPDPDRFGYVFSLDNPAGMTTHWWGQAWPKDPGVTGDRWFYVDITGVIRYSTTGPANASSIPLGEPGG